MTDDGDGDGDGDDDGDDRGTEQSSIRGHGPDTRLDKLIVCQTGQSERLAFFYGVTRKLC